LAYICLILVLGGERDSSLSQGRCSAAIVGAFLIGLELYIPSGILGVGGIIAMVLGAIYLVDVSRAPDLAVAYSYIVPVALVLGGFMLLPRWPPCGLFDAARRRAAKGLVGEAWQGDGELYE